MRSPCISAGDRQPWTTQSIPRYEESMHQRRGQATIDYTEYTKVWESIHQRRGQATMDYTEYTKV